MTNSLIELVTNPAVRHDYVITMEGKIVNSNGDPNGGNCPRQLPTGHVYATSTSMSSRINQTAALLYNANILYAKGNKLADIQLVYEKDGKTPIDLMRDYWDRRGNGGLFTTFVEKKGNKKDKEKVKAPKQYIESAYSGIYRIYPSISVNIPNLIEQAITSPTFNADDKQTMGSASYADWIVTKGTGTYNACLNIKRGSIIDAEYMAQWLVCLWHHALQTASLQRGQWDIVDCLIATHYSPYGCAQLSSISDLVEIEIDEERKTHQITIGEAPKNVQFTRLSTIIDDLIAAYPPTVGSAA